MENVTNPMCPTCGLTKINGPGDSGCLGFLSSHKAENPDQPIPLLTVEQVRDRICKHLVGEKAANCINC